AVFAFLITLSREIIKDCEDVDGDRQNGCDTFPVKFGEPAARKTASVITFILLATLVWVQYSQHQWDDMRAFIYVTLCIDIPLLILIYKSWAAMSKKDDRRNGILAKLIMITGILSMAVFYSSF
ncbi:MAG TPA: UbiA family prenyltransferase, partial [Bacteroidia bacterium]|nr:UbiA family prenyltransferase [Bacteroidia bacterium]